MTRYRNTPVTTVGSERGNRTNRLYTTIYAEVPEENDDMHFIAQEGDRLDNLAFRFYRNPHLWWFIARVNHLTDMNVPAGTKLRIPVSTDRAQGF